MVLGFARTTGGEYFRALAPSLPRALEQVDESLAKNAESRELLHIAIEEPSSNPSLSALREQGATVSRELVKAKEALTRTSSTVNQLQAAVERYALLSYNAVQEVEEQCVALGRECILLLDHLDIMIHRAEEKSHQADSLRSARGRLCNLLEGAQIEEIPVKPGDVFDSAVQVATSVVASSSRDGLVVAVLRKGYEMKVRGRDVILRPAEVTVTRCMRNRKLEPGGRNETKARY